MFVYATLFGMASAESVVIVDNNISESQQKQILEANSVSATRTMQWHQVQQDFSAMRFLSDTNTIPCQSDARQIEDIDKGMEIMENMINYFQTDLFVDQITKVHEMVVCAKDIVPTPTMTRLFFLEGLMYFYLQQEQDSTNAFKQALAIDEKLVWDDDFEPSGKEGFDQAKQSLKLTNPTILYTHVYDRNNLFVDGVQVTEDTRLYPGFHIIQALGANKTVESTIGFVVTKDKHNAVLQLPKYVQDASLQQILVDEKQQAEIVSYLEKIYPKTEIYMLTPTGKFSYSVWSKEEQGWKAGKEIHDSAHRKKMIMGLAGSAVLTYGLSYAAYTEFGKIPDGNADPNKVATLQMATNSLLVSSVVLGVSTVWITWRTR